ncbi:hypothetical protein H1O16_gp224 [Burkholderia phage BcepSaruman]|nr:hypothetical protein H1O16_gp224 [Burkholderia phage BcepSaruman]QBX06637.1 hypothetical protein BcepSaruman_224 [Burkholderia phage BcepSaruman]
MPVLPVLDVEHVMHGQHTNSWYKGQWSMAHVPGTAHTVVALPQRGKFMDVYTASADLERTEAIGQHIADSLRDLDSKHAGSRWLYKLHMLMQETGADVPYTSIINNMSEHASFSLLSQGIDLGVYGVYDTVNRSVQLVWTTDPDFVQRTRATEPTRYLFHRYPVVRDRPLFIHTENVCAKWYVWKQAFTNVDGVLKAFNVLENFLFKNPEVAEIRR